MKGTTIEAITDSAGNYSINNIPVGSQTLQVDSIGHKSKTVTLNILAGTNEKDIFLETDISGVRTVGGKVTGVSANGEIGLGGVNIQLFTEVGKPADYSQKTTDNGAYEFSEVESGTYMASAAYDGYLTDSKQVLVKSNDIKALNFRLKLARRLDFDLSKLRASLDVKEGTEMSEKLERYYSSRMGDYQQAIETMAKKAATPKMRKAINAVNKFTTAKTISSGNLNNTYDIAMNELIAAWDKSPADEKSAYIHGLQSITGAYLDRSAIVQRARLDKKSADQLENMARVFKANENLNMEPFLQEWLKQSEGYSTRAYKNNVKRYFNLS
ncbi:MAG: carboxypeptidase regulatory-like domain-containing protein [Bacteroidota bacterium]